MLAKLELENVRLFCDREWGFDLRPMTIFCGTNSAGKSTIIKSILLLRQSQGIYETNPPTKSRLRFTGSQVDLGDYRSFVSNNDTSKSLSIALTISDSLPIAVLDGIGDFVVSEKDTRKWQPYTLRSKFKFNGQSTSIPVLDPLDEQPRNGGALQSAEFTFSVGSDSPISWQVQAVEGRSEKRHPDVNKQQYIITIPRDLGNQGGLDAIIDFRDSYDKKQYVLPVHLKGILPDNLVSRLRKSVFQKSNRAKDADATRAVPLPMPFLINGVLRDLRNALADVHYLGPLRAPAKRYYVANQESSPGMDSSGEFLPYVLRENAQTVVEYAEPKTWRILNTSLTQALNFWLMYLRTGQIEEPLLKPDEIRVSKTKDVLVEFEVKAPAGTGLHSLADSGFGYSQILPILVRGLLATDGSTLIIEQPELHLNPALQIRLAEFLVSLVKTGRQVVLETHSEHIVNSIRVLAAEDESGDIASKAAIYFLEAKSQKPVVHDLSIQKDGTVPGWPRQFFGEALSLTSRLLGAQRRKRLARGDK